MLGWMRVPGNWTGGPVWKQTLWSAPLPTSHNQPDEKAQARFGLVVMLLCWVNRGRLQFLLQNNTGQRREILPQTFPPSHCAHRDRPCINEAKTLQELSRERLSSFDSPSPLGCSLSIAQKCWAGSAQGYEHFQLVSPHSVKFPLEKN